MSVPLPRKAGKAERPRKEQKEGKEVGMVAGGQPRRQSTKVRYRICLGKEDWEQSKGMSGGCQRREFARGKKTLKA